MKRTKKWISMILAATMVFSVLPVNALAAEEPSMCLEDTIEPENVVLPENQKYEGNVSYAAFDNNDYEMPFFYDDNYFAKSAYEYQDSLSTMTLCMALASFASSKSPNDYEGYQTKSCNLEKLLKDCGFPEENFSTNRDFTVKPTKDSIGVGASSKLVTDEGKPYTLIAIGIRGNGYESEWASNFTMGDAGQHKGFSQAKFKVLSYLSEYIADKGITGDIKIWITGYSRAAAVANLTAGALDNGYNLSDSVSLTPEDIYAYCFECPRPATKADNVTADVYKNIFNIINPVDHVTKYGPDEPDNFGFARYGVDKYLPTKAKSSDMYDELKDAMLARFYTIPTAKEYVVDDFKMKKFSLSKGNKNGIITDDENSSFDQDAFLEDAIYTFFKVNVRNRGVYDVFYENDLRELSYALFGCGDKWKDFENNFINNLKLNAPSLIKYIVLHKDYMVKRTFEKTITNSLSQAGITDYTATQIKGFAAKMAALIIPFAVDNPDYMATIIENIHSIDSAHYFELCMAWLQSFDSNYTPGAESAFLNNM